MTRDRTLTRIVTTKAFAPRTFQILQDSFEEALGALPDRSSADERLRDLIARRIISLAEQGETDPLRLREAAIARVRTLIKYRGVEAP